MAQLFRWIGEALQRARKGSQLFRLYDFVLGSPYFTCHPLERRFSPGQRALDVLLREMPFLGRRLGNFVDIFPPSHVLNEIPAYLRTCGPAQILQEAAYRMRD